MRRIENIDGIVASPLPWTVKKFKGLNEDLYLVADADAKIVAIVSTEHDARVISQAANMAHILNRYYKGVSCSDNDTYAKWALDAVRGSNGITETK